MTSTKLFKVAVKLASTADTFGELLVQLVELITQQTNNNVVHCLRKHLKVIIEIKNVVKHCEDIGLQRLKDRYSSIVISGCVVDITEINRYYWLLEETAIKLCIQAPMR